MSLRKLILSAGLLVAVCAAATSQQPVPAAPPVIPPLTAPRLDFAPPAPPKVAPPVDLVPAVPTPPPEKSVDELLNELERVQAQKAELEKKELELKATLLKKLEKQSERLKKLGVAAPAKEAKPREPDRVARIIIEGNVRTPDRVILKYLGFVPGQILRYPALGEARASLENAGFRGVAVEVIDNGGDSPFKDIRVRVEEPKPEPAPAPRSPSARG